MYFFHSLVVRIGGEEPAVFFGWARMPEEKLYYTFLWPSRGCTSLENSSIRYRKKALLFLASLVNFRLTLRASQVNNYPNKDVSVATVKFNALAIINKLGSPPFRYLSELKEKYYPLLKKEKSTIVKRDLLWFDTGECCHEGVQFDAGARSVSRMRFI
jgi:hypothetical protein